MTLSFCFMLIHRGLGIFNLGSFGKNRFFAIEAQGPGQNGKRSARIDARDGIAHPHTCLLPQEKGNGRADDLGLERRPMIENQSCGEFSLRTRNLLVRHYPYFKCTVNVDSLAPARSVAARDLCSDRAEHTPLAVSQTARVFVTTPIFG
jgi:hypothetical protein